MQEARHATRVFGHQVLEGAVVELQQHAVVHRAGGGGTQVVADQQAQLAEEAPRAELLEEQVVAEHQLDHARFHDVHGAAAVAFGEQLLAGLRGAAMRLAGEQRELGFADHIAVPRGNPHGGLAFIRRIASAATIHASCPPQ